MTAAARWTLLCLWAASPAVLPATLDPPTPVAGETLTLTLPEAVLQRGHELIVRDPEQARVVTRFRIGRYPRPEIRIELPPDVRSLVLELRDGQQTLLRLPETGHFEPAAASADRPPTLAHCPDLPPEDRDELAAWLQRCALDHAPLVERDLRGVDLTGRSLWRADLRGADLSDARLRNADLTGASLAGARLDGADLAGATLHVADLSSTSLFVTDFDGADLRDADLRHARLSHTSFSNADLSGARLQDALLDATDFTGATCPDGTRTVDSCGGHLELP